MPSLVVQDRATAELATRSSLAATTPAAKAEKRSRRKSSLKTFFLPVTTKSPVVVSPEGTTVVGSLPEDIVREIVDRLQPNDILSFSLTSTHLRRLLLPALYDTVVLKSSRACRTALLMFREKRYLCRYIRKLAVRPNYYLAWPKPDDYLEEEWVAEMLIGLSDDLTVLNTFDWDALELPPDRLWDSLSKRCPTLKSISTNIGRKNLDPDSSLFQFRGLTSFSLIARHGLPSTSELLPIPEDLPDAFWDMILNRCPDLEELAICTFSPTTRLFDIDRIMEVSEGTLSEFLEGHKGLKYLRFLWNFRHFMSPDSIVFTLPSNSLPALTTFIGIYQQLANTPNPQTIETLDLTCEPIYQSRMTAVCSILRGLPNLTSLEIWVHLFDSDSDHTHFFHSIMEACPKLTDFHFMCTNSFTAKPLKQLLSGLYLLPELKRFSLTKGHKYFDEPMLETAMKVVRQAPKVKQVNLRWARERCPNHLKQEGSYDVVCHEETGMPCALNVVEKGIALVGGPFFRQYQHTFNLGIGQSTEWQKTVSQRTRVVRKRVSSMLSIRQLALTE
ncbi:hypothetical protein H1R20_g4665, partial [Candolleomyces eurysporus]